MASWYSNAFRREYREPTWEDHVRINRPDPEYTLENIAQDEARIPELQKLIAFAEEMGYEFLRDDVYGGPVPQDEIDEIVKRLTQGPKKAHPVGLPTALENAIIDQVFQSSSAFSQMMKAK